MLLLVLSALASCAYGSAVLGESNPCSDSVDYPLLLRHAMNMLASPLSSFSTSSGSSCCSSSSSASQELLRKYLAKRFHGNWTALSLNLTSDNERVRRATTKVGLTLGAPGCIDVDSLQSTLELWGSESFDIVQKEDCWRRRPMPSNCTRKLGDEWLEGQYDAMTDRLLLAG